LGAIIADVLRLSWGGRDLEPENVEPHSRAAVAEESWNSVNTASMSLGVEGDLDLRAAVLAPTGFGESVSERRRAR